MQVDKIKLGTVIDHIKAGLARKVLRILDIGENYPHLVAYIMNVPSGKLGRKDLLKIEGKIISHELADAIALISPHATINIIKDSKIVEKYEVEAPQKIVNLGKCPNPACIVNKEGEKLFTIEKTKHKDLRYRCEYCERVFDSSEILS